MKKESFFSTACGLAIPVALQSMLQSSFSIVDQVMLGQLGESSIAGVGFAGKFSSIYSVIVSAVGAVAGIMLSQYLGQKNSCEIRRSFWINLWIALALAGAFTGVCLLMPQAITGLYTTDKPTMEAAAGYLQIISLTFLPMAGATMLSTLLRCLEKARLPLYASIASAIANTGLNYILIFGHCGLPAMGAVGAAWATVIAQVLNTAVMLVMALRAHVFPAPQAQKAGRFELGQYLHILLPILLCELMWVLGENVYAIIYGHLGTDAAAAMTLINPVQGLLIGALCGLSQAAGVLIGKRLGRGEDSLAYAESKKLLLYGLVGSVILSAGVILARSAYVGIYQVSGDVRLTASAILTVFALIAPAKVLNVILGGGILRSGGKTTYIMCIDILGTWAFGVPLGLMGAFVLDLSIPYVYFLLSLEELVRLGISLVLFRRRKWMHTLKSQKSL